MDKERDTSDNIPVPDPSALTTATIYREVNHIKETINIRINSIEKRIDSVDRSLEATWQSITLIPPEVDKQITHLTKLNEIERQCAKELNQERFIGSKAAFDVALVSAKDAVSEQNKSSALAISKSEAAVTKQMDQLGLMINTANGAMNDKIDDIKGRLTLIEGKGTGLNAGWGMLIGAAALAAALMSIFNVVRGLGSAS